MAEDYPEDGQFLLQNVGTYQTAWYYNNMITIKIIHHHKNLKPFNGKISHSHRE
jgi:hypothetical protein